MTTMFIDTYGEMSFVDNERLKFIMHYLKQGADDSLVEMKDGRFVREDSELSFTEIWLPSAEHQQRKIDEQQAKVEELQKKLSEYIFVAETIDEMYVKEVQKSDELQKRVDKAIRLLVEAELYQSEPNIDLAVKALKGEGTPNLNIDEKGECRHFSTTMFFFGKAECFHCDAVVNEDREIIGKQSKGFCWPAKERDQ